MHRVTVFNRTGMPLTSGIIDGLPILWRGDRTQAEEWERLYGRSPPFQKLLIRKTHVLYGNLSMAEIADVQEAIELAPIDEHALCTSCRRTSAIKDSAFCKLDALRILMHDAA